MEIRILAQQKRAIDQRIDELRQLMQDDSEGFAESPIKREYALITSKTIVASAAPTPEKERSRPPNTWFHQFATKKRDRSRSRSRSQSTASNPGPTPSITETELNAEDFDESEPLHHFGSPSDRQAYYAYKRGGREPQGE